MLTRPRLASLLLVALSLAPAPASAAGGVVERVVAVVADEPILLSELRERAVPLLMRIEASVPAGAQRAAAASEMYRELLRTLIDEQLIARAASAARVAVTPAEIDAALAEVGKSNHLTLPALLAAAAEQGLSEEAYRDELRRQLLSAKLFYPWARAHSSYTGPDLYEHLDSLRKPWLAGLRAGVVIEVRL